MNSGQIRELKRLISLLDQAKEIAYRLELEGDNGALLDCMLGSIATDLELRLDKIIAARAPKVAK